MTKLVEWLTYNLKILHCNYFNVNNIFILK